MRDRRDAYRKGFEIVHTLIDVVSKNGNLLLNVPLTGEGELEEEVITMFKDMGHDFDLLNYTCVVMETLADTGFKEAPVASAVVPAKVSSGGPRTVDGPLEALIDGKVGKGGNPIYQNGVTDGAYKLDLGESKSVAQVNTFSSTGRNRAKQNYILYGSNAAADPGWYVADAAVFAPIMAVDTREVEPQEFEVTSVRRSDGKPLGAYRWLVWAVSPITGEIGGENSAYQELQVIPGR